MPRNQSGSRSGGSFGRGKKPGDRNSFSKKKMFGGLRKPAGTRGGKAPSKAPRKAPPVKVSVDSMVDEDQLNDGKVRLQKYLASAGLGSRRKCEELIQSGRISIDGEPVTEMGIKVDPTTQSIEFDGGRLKRQTLTYYIFNKPKGVLCTNVDPDGRQRVIDFFPPNGPRVFPVGRLDEDSEGLLLVTNDGNWGNKLAHPRYRIYRTYLVQVAGHPNDETLQQLIRGMFFTEGKFRFHLVERKKKQGRSSFLEVTLAEGKNREVRRLFARVGHKVMKLLRVGFGPLKLGRLKTGEHRTLTPIEMQMVADIWSKAKSQPVKEETRPTEFKTITLFDKQDEQAPAQKTKKQDQAKFAKIKGKIVEADYDDEEELVFQQFLDSAEEPTDEDLAYRDETDISVPANDADMEEVYTDELEEELDMEEFEADEMDHVSDSPSMQDADLSDAELSDEDFTEEDFTEAYSEEDYFEEEKEPPVIVTQKQEPTPENKPLFKSKSKSVAPPQSKTEPEKPQWEPKKEDKPAFNKEDKPSGKKEEPRSKSKEESRSPLKEEPRSFRKESLADSSGRGSLFKKKKHSEQGESEAANLAAELESEVPEKPRKYDDTAEPEVINTAPGITEEEAPALDEMYQDEMFFFADEADDGETDDDEEGGADYEEYMVETDEDFEEKPPRGRRGGNDRGPSGRESGNRGAGNRDSGNRGAGNRGAGNRGTGSREFGNRRPGAPAARDRSFGERSSGNNSEGARGPRSDSRPAGPRGRTSGGARGERSAGFGGDRPSAGGSGGGRRFQRDEGAGGNFRGRADRSPAGGDRRRSFSDRDESSSDRPARGGGGFRGGQGAGRQDGPPRRGQGARAGGPGRPMGAGNRPPREDGERSEFRPRGPAVGRERFSRDTEQPRERRGGFGRRDEQGGGEQRTPRGRPAFGADRAPRGRTGDGGNRGPRTGSRDAGSRPGFRDRNQGDESPRGSRGRGDQGSDPHFFGERKEMPNLKRKPNMRRNKKKKD
jgi:23S rRNA pseudouridine2605 synthase